MRFGVLGTGRITRRMVAEIQSTPGADVAVIASRDADRARWSGGQFGIARWVEGYENVLADPHVDAVYVALPPSLHARWCLAAAAAGKHVLCEKPLAIDGDEAVQIHDALTAAGLRWLDATAWLHHERTADMLARLAAGELGTLKHVSAAVSFFEPFQDRDHRRDADLGGGCLLDLGWYAAGCAVAAAGKPQTVLARCRSEKGIIVRADAIVTFDNGVTASVNCGYDTSTRKWCEWAGDRASIVCDDFTRPWHDRPPRVWIHDRAGAVQKLEYSGSQERNMIAAFCGDGDLSGFERQALRTQAVLDAMLAAGDSGQVESVRCE